jgi:hypothetical protein
MKLRTPLAWKNLTHDPRRLVIAVSGVAFAVILIFMELGFLNATGPRVEESGLGLISYHPYSAPYEDLKVKK